jgi:hypothetical protein
MSTVNDVMACEKREKLELVLREIKERRESKRQGSSLLLLGRELEGAGRELEGRGRGPSISILVYRHLPI